VYLPVCCSNEWYISKYAADYGASACGSWSAAYFGLTILIFCNVKTINCSLEQTMGWRINIGPITWRKNNGILWLQDTRGKTWTNSAAATSADNFTRLQIFSLEIVFAPGGPGPYGARPLRLQPHQPHWISGHGHLHGTWVSLTCLINGWTVE